jgi:hypothetical protein
MAETAVRVDLTNNLEGQPEAVHFALAGLAYVTGALISVGEDAVVATEPEDLSDLFQQINASLSVGAVRTALEGRHPNIVQLLEDTEEHTTDPSFGLFIQRLGALGSSYELAPDEEDPKHFSLTFIGHD